MATASKRTIKRSSRARARRRREYLELVQRCWPLLTLRDACDLQPEGGVEPVECLNVS